MKKKVAIVIPIYKPTLTQYEKVALDKCFSVLSNYPIIIVAPESLDLDQIISRQISAKIIRFPDLFFNGIAGYNHLMLSNLFYEAFTNYEYMLIYQLDAYIFEDELLEWCSRGYDYIGAPWIPAQKYEQARYKYGLKLMNFFCRMSNIKTGAHNYYHVGNGGFSLRKVESFIRITSLEKERIAHYLSRKGSRFHEDVFWGVDIARRHKDFRVPAWKEALEFSFDVRPQLAYKYANNRLPIGCHGWYTQSHSPFWKKHIHDYPSRVRIQTAK